jgi:hypothetical protein
MATLALNTMGDTYISLLNPTTNYGSTTGLSRSWNYAPNEETRALIKFDRDAIISALAGGTVTNVLLYEYAQNNNSASDSYKIKRCGDFTESTVTYNTRPTVYENVDAVYSPVGISWKSNDITSLWAAQSSGSVFAVTIEAYTSGAYVNAHSRENASGNIPYLYITYTPAPLNDVYVDINKADDTGAGTSWATAKKTMKAGWDILNATGTMHVASGDYSAQTTIDYNKTWSLSPEDPNSTGTKAVSIPKST